MEVKNQNSSGIGCMIVTILIVGFVVNRSCEGVQRYKSTKAREELAAYREPFPESGFVKTYTYLPRRSPLKISTSAEGNFLVKLVDSRSGNPVQEIYIREGDQVTVKVPDGTYGVRYACGREWYGRKRLFGPDTSCSRADQLLTFSRGQGYEVSLFKSPGGNLRTQSIDVTDF